MMIYRLDEANDSKQVSINYLVDACSDRRAYLVQMLAVVVDDCLQKLDPVVDRRRCGNVVEVDLVLGSESQSSRVHVEVEVH